ncbi:hypothetical protein HMN09_00184300 [Mycena chlorophos]|uniref:Alpha-L-arabinofuranosidase n=1 Tax=Mycena chlorophos TaxID=658473 RepID=A0A8H6TL32_MYCCL|nr:hypothetical protein HMN09_00184300 [Mycena chlorophos]
MRILTWNINGVRTLPQYHPNFEGILNHLDAGYYLLSRTKNLEAQPRKKTGTGQTGLASFFAKPSTTKTKGKARETTEVNVLDDDDDDDDEADYRLALKLSQESAPPSSSPPKDRNAGAAWGRLLRTQRRVDRFFSLSRATTTASHKLPGRCAQGSEPGGKDELAAADGAPVTQGVWNWISNDATTGVATGDEPEGLYAVFDGTHVNNVCCFDYGNAEVNNDDNGNGHMEAIYFGTFAGGGTGSGPWIKADLENGVFASNSGRTNKPQQPDASPTVRPELVPANRQEREKATQSLVWLSDALLRHYNGLLYAASNGGSSDFDRTASFTDDE